MLAYDTQAFGDNGAVLHMKIPFTLKQKCAWLNVTKYTNIQIVLCSCSIMNPTTPEIFIQNKSVLPILNI